jgi:MATE family, multidrug efflux pump
MVIPFKAKYLEIRHLLKESWAMGWPMILIMFFQFAIGLTDVYVAGYLGTDVLAAVGYVAQLYWTLMIMANGLSVGTVSMVSQAYGAKSNEGVGCITANSLLVGLCVAGVLTVIAQLYPAAIVRAAGMPVGIQVIAESFIQVFSLVLVPTYLMIISGGVLRSSGRIHVSMMNSLVAASVNVVGELALSFGWGPIPAFGYIGIAWATAIATTLGMALNLTYVCSGPAGVTLRSLVSPLFGCVWNLLKLGWPTALQQTAWNVGTLMVYFLVGRLQGGQITALAAMTAGVRIEAIIFLPIFALNMASAVLTGNRLGAGDVAGARSGAKVTSMLCLAIIILPAMGIFILAPNISGLLTQDPAVLHEMTRYLRINMLGMPFMAIGVTLSGALQGAGDTFATMRIIFTGMWLLRIPFILGAIYILRTSALGIWWCMTVSIIIMCGLLAHRFRGDAWTKASVDKSSNTMLWEACLPSGQRSARQELGREKTE